MSSASLGSQEPAFLSPSLAQNPSLLFTAQSGAAPLRPSQVTTRPRLVEKAELPPAPPGGWTAPAKKPVKPERTERLRLGEEIVSAKDRPDAFVSGDAAGHGAPARHAAFPGASLAGEA